MIKKQLTKKQNIANWKKGVNDVKNINSIKYTRNLKGGIRLP